MATCSNHSSMLSQRRTRSASVLDSHLDNGAKNGTLKSRGIKKPVFAPRSKQNDTLLGEPSSGGVRRNRSHGGSSDSMVKGCDPLLQSRSGDKDLSTKTIASQSIEAGQASASHDDVGFKIVDGKQPQTETLAPSVLFASTTSPRRILRSLSSLVETATNGKSECHAKKSQASSAQIIQKRRRTSLDNGSLTTSLAAHDPIDCHPVDTLQSENGTFGRTIFQKVSVMAWSDEPIEGASMEDVTRKDSEPLSTFAEKVKRFCSRLVKCSPPIDSADKDQINSDQLDQRRLGNLTATKRVRSTTKNEVNVDEVSPSDCPPNGRRRKRSKIPQSLLFDADETKGDNQVSEGASREQTNEETSIMRTRRAFHTISVLEQLPQSPHCKRQISIEQRHDYGNSLEPCETASRHEPLERSCDTESSDEIEYESDTAARERALKKVTTHANPSRHGSLSKELRRERASARARSLERGIGESSTAQNRSKHVLSSSDLRWNFRTVHRMASIKILAGLYGSAVELCNSEISKWYQSVDNIIPLERVKELSADSPYFQQVMSVREGIAGMWCVYAHVLGEIGAHCDRSRISSSTNGHGVRDRKLGKRSGTGKKGSTINADLGNDLVYQGKGPIPMLHMGPANQFFQFLRYAQTLLDIARCCPFVGNHPWIVIARSRLMIYEQESKVVGTPPDSLLRAVLCANVRATIPRAITYCYQGMVTRPAATSAFVDCVDPSELDEERRSPKGVFGLVCNTEVNSASDEIQASFLAMIRLVKSRTPNVEKYIVTDTVATKLICQEINRLSYLEEVLSKSSSERLKRGFVPDVQFGLDDFKFFDSTTVDIAPCTEGDANDQSIPEAISTAPYNVTETATPIFEDDLGGVVEQSEDGWDMSLNGNEIRPDRREKVPREDESFDNASGPNSTASIRQFARGHCSQVEFACKNCPTCTFASESGLVTHRSKCSNSIDVARDAQHLREPNREKLGRFPKHWPVSFDPEQGRSHDDHDLIDVLDYVVDFVTVTREEIHALTGGTDDSSASTDSEDDDFEPNPLFVGQVGICCRSCRELTDAGYKEAFIFPSSKQSLSRCMWRLCLGHLDSCSKMPRNVKQRYQHFREQIPLNGTMHSSYWEYVASSLVSAKGKPGVVWKSDRYY